MNTIKTTPNFEQVQNGVTWIGGPTNQLQRQHIPGYQGHVHGLFSQNVHGKSFARVSAECINERNYKGIDVEPDIKYKSIYKQQFNGPDQRRTQFINTAQSILKKVQQSQMQLNHHLQSQYAKKPKNIEQLPPIDRIPVVGYMGHKPVFRPPRKEVKVQNPPPRVELAQKKIIAEMVANQTLDENKFAKLNKNVPVVGYSGFMKGIKAENQYAQNFENLARNSVRH